MIEDDIQYLGSRTTPRHPFCSTGDPHRPLTGLTLHVEKSDEEEAYRLMFRKASVNTIDIGRPPPAASGAERRQKDSENGKAMFRCPVVSRRHARITLSDTGVAWITDLSSHHGTHIRKPEEVVSKTITPDVATRLADGDIITLGKIVGKAPTITKPVVCRVEILYGSDLSLNLPPIKQLETPSTSATSKSSSTGRYGVNVSSPSSSDSSSAPPSDFSDVEVEDVTPLSIVKPTVSSLIHGASPMFSRLPLLSRFSSSPAYFPQSPSPQPPSDILAPSPPRAGDMMLPEIEEIDKPHQESEPMEFSPSPDPFLSPPPPADPVVVGAWPNSRASSEQPKDVEEVKKKTEEEVRAIIESINADVEKLQTSRRRSKIRTSMNAARISELEDKYDTDVPDLQAQIDRLQEQIGWNETEEAGNLEELKSIAAEIRELRDKAQKEVDIITAAKEAAMAVIAEAQKQIQEYAASTTADLKRKRDEMEEELRTPSVAPDPVEAPVIAVSPPRKRARTFVRTIGAVTVGAVAAWSALAFY